MGKPKLCSRELDQLDRLKHENRSLKRQVKRLQKLLKRNPIESHSLEEKKPPKPLFKAKSRKCWNCSLGELSITILNRRDGVYYYRRCPECEKRTKLKRYNSKVEH